MKTLPTYSRVGSFLASVAFRCFKNLAQKYIYAKSTTFYQYNDRVAVFFAGFVVI